MRSAACRGLIVLLVMAMPRVLPAQREVPDSGGPRVRFGAFLDTYLAWDFNRPPARDRAFTTAAVRHAEFNLNLAHLDAVLAAPRLRARLALQFGTSVQANYASEPRTGATSGPEVSRFIQEAVAGYRLTPALWIDAGVFLSALGSESWVSRDNWTYTRSLIADNSPYYEAGVKLTWQASHAVSAQLHLINGWQNMSESNDDKALVVRTEWVASADLTVSYDAFVGNEAAEPAPSRPRVFQEVFARYVLSPRAQLMATGDIGIQKRETSGHDTWHGFALMGRVQVSRTGAVAGRLEGFWDPRQVVLVTGQTSGLRAWGASLNLDVAPDSQLLWRTEVRHLFARDALFPTRRSGAPSARDAVVVTSLALSF